MEHKGSVSRPDQPARPRRPEWKTPELEDIGVSAEVTAYMGTWRFDLD